MNRRLFVTGTLTVTAALGLHVASSARAPSITGHAVDGAGYPIPGATVTVAPQAGGTVGRTMTAADGTYAFEDLPADTYRLEFALLGFDITRRNHVRVRANATASTDATLQISAICECVNVTDATELRERSGQVVNDSGRPLAHARLEIKTPLRSEMSYADIEGRFRVRVPVIGSWPLTASDTGFAAVTRQVSWTAETPVVLKLSWVGTAGVADTERLRQPCCPPDLFTHDGP